MACLTPDDYTVAWVCALPLEAAAARVMLDKIHPLPKGFRDENAYEFGETNGHNIVIAYLPAGVYGKVSAAAVVTRIRLTFRQLRFALMVGIGGGVPWTEKNDIRLGDVVVSKPGPEHSGVIQYDYGKAVQGGVFEESGTTNKPPSVLLTHLNQLEAKGMTVQGGDHDVYKIIRQVLEQNPCMRGRFGAPGAHTDLLFKPSYHHTVGQEACGTCDREQLIQRGSRETSTPRIHYGLIASGDQVMKDSETRDRLAQKHGILCFEMEAAGLMNQLSTLVIRGICDYCDSHKLKQWQGYAALTAAAYAKFLLSVVPAYYVNSGSSNIKKARRHWEVPLAKNPRFAGRNGELERLEYFIAAQDGPRRIAITGLGGCGKTQVALHMAYQVRDKDKECSVFWIQCTSRAMIEQDLLKVAEAIGLHSTKPTEVKRELKLYLTSERSGRWLLIFDNVDDEETWFATPNNPGPALEDFLPQSSQGRIVFTTRNRKLAMKLAPFELMPIPDVDKQTAFQIMQNTLRAKDLVPDETTIVLLEQLAYLPLAITQASAYIIANGLSLSTYLEMLQKHEQDAVALLSEDFRDPGRYQDLQNAVVTTWLISFKQIQNKNPLAADYLSFMAIIHPRNIPLSLLPPPTSRKQQLEAIGLLNAYSFTSGQEPDIHMHRLVHIATRNWLRHNGLFDHWVRTVADRMKHAFPDNDHSKRALWRESLPHALSLVHEHVFTQQEHRHWDLIRNIAHCLTADGRHSEAEVLYKKLLTINELQAGLTDPSTIDSMAELAANYFSQGRWKDCGDLETRVLETRKRVVGNEHPDTIRSLLGCAQVYIHQGRLGEAEDLASQALDLSKRLVGLEDPLSLDCQQKLAHVYWVQRQMDRCLQIYLPTIERMKAVYGAEDHRTVSAMSMLALALHDMGEYAKSEKLETEIVETCKTHFGDEHPDTLSNMQHLANLYRSQQRWNEAEELGSDILAKRERVLGGDHPETLVTLAFLALLYHRQEQYAKAADLGVRIVSGRSSTLGPEHPVTLTSIASLAQTRKCQGRLSDAINLLEKCCRLRNKVLGPEHPSSKRSSSNLVNWKGEYSKLLSERPLPLPARSNRLQDSRQFQSLGQHKIGLSHYRSLGGVLLSLGGHPLLAPIGSSPSAQLRTRHDLDEVD